MEVVETGNAFQMSKTDVCTVGLVKFACLKISDKIDRNKIDKLLNYTNIF